jgi:predicted enzyme related to lactoylglutathione lyase
MALPSPAMHHGAREAGRTTPTEDTMVQHGTFMWNELATPDPERAKAFYGEICNWGAREMDMPGGDGKYTLWRLGDKDVGGMMKMEGPQWKGIPPHWMTYIAVDDVNVAAKKVKKLGGEVKVEPFDIPGIGRMCVITDPTGATVSLMTPVPGSQ